MSPLVTSDRAYQLKRLATLRMECAQLTRTLHGPARCGTNFADVDLGILLDVTFNVRAGAVEIVSVSHRGMDLTPMAPHIRDLQEKVQLIYDERQTLQHHLEQQADADTGEVRAS